ncbi:MAG TPA: SpvB/TcaC N-terminal domain-containing protein [Thermoanaerobaculia bacterium]|nr:SpvB/TcaC N-terminal domain-containing protein [Thermoanaerobaculia bacterium]
MEPKSDSAGPGVKGVSAPTLSLPKGGGAVRGIGEKFGVNPVTGTGSLSVPLPLSPGRAGFGPQLALSYDSGAGNGPFGFGWSLGLPSITRKTDKGLPRYLDAEESDVFILSGAEDLVPVLDAADQRVPPQERTVYDVAYKIYRYRPRLEGLFARIERWVAKETGVSHWRSISRDNVTTLYGFDPDSRIADPTDPRRIFSYLICRTFDDKGNVAVYHYAAEDGRGVNRSQAHEANRGDPDRLAQRYLQSIRYGNQRPYFPSWSVAGPETPLPGPDEWHFEAVFDYGDHSPDLPLPEPDSTLPWPVRPDPFSTYRAGFEVRTYRRCERVLLFHHFAAEPGVGKNCLVRSTDLFYSDEETPADPKNPIYTFLRSVTQTGYRRQGTGYVHRSLPPLEFEYSQPRVRPEVLTLDAESLANLPEGLDGSRFQWVDLDGEGLSGILTDHGGGWGYKRNLSPLNQVTLADGSRATRARFGPLEAVAVLPSRSELGGGQQLLDLAGDGLLDVVTLGEPVPGFFERTADGGWEPFRAFASLPRLDWSEPNLKFVDLTGDGHADVLLTEEGLFTFYPSLGEAGFGEAGTVRPPWDEERGPQVVLADEAQTIFLADLSGDGLSDLVRIRNGEVCYWPNLGYGRFGAKVTMDGAPRFTDEERFDARHIRLADVDGSGTTDLLYVGEDGVQVCFNRSGNSWAEPHRLAVFPTADNLSAVQATDLLGTGTACLVWSSPLPSQTAAPLRYVDLMGGEKPHLLVRSRNNLGAETRTRYAPSTRFYLADKTAGKPWITRLPFPVHVVERVETYDWIGRSRFATRYAYHHGYFDGFEREFRGFGMIEQWDTEEQRGDTSFPEAEATNWDAASWTPPMLTRTWFHTGAFVEAGAVSRQYAGEYWSEPALSGDDREAMLLPDAVLPSDLTADEIREAYRALKGMALRTEVYAQDGTPAAAYPYSVTEQNFTVRREQAMAGNRHAVFFVHPREKLSFHYERQPQDPRVTHEATLQVDLYGNVERSVSIGYPRRPGHPDPEPGLSTTFQGMLAYDQQRLHIAATENHFTEDTLTDPVLFPDTYRTPRPAETITAELTGIQPAANRTGITNLFRFTELDNWPKIWDRANVIPYEEVPGSDVDGAGALPTVPTRRVVEHTRTIYRRDDLTALLPPGELQPLALPGDSYRLALTPGLVQRVFDTRVPDTTLTEGGYAQLPGGTDWWMPSGRVFYSPGDADTPAVESAEARNHFYQPRRFVDPFGAVTRVTQDPYDLLVSGVTDAAGNATAAVNDYRVLQPSRITDPNGNPSLAAFDALGLVTGNAVLDKTETLGDSLSDFEPDLDPAKIAEHLDRPLSKPDEILGKASARLLYDLFAYHRTRDAAQPDPPVVYTLSRETHVSDLAPGETTLYQHAFVYSDGLGREIQRKAQAEKGPVESGGPDVSPRWVGSGWTLFNNKGKPVRKYEPFFSATHRFEFARQTGVSSVLFYDPAERVIATLHPNDTWEKVVFDAWLQETWDVNDTVRFPDPQHPTVLVSDPRLDEQVGGFFRRFLGEDPGAFTSWYDRRIGGTFGSTPEEGAAEKDAAIKTADHAGTPGRNHFDALGRACLAVAHNGGTERHATRTAFDAEGKPLAVFDARGYRVVEHCLREPLGTGGFLYVVGYDYAGNAIYHNGMDNGARRSLANVAGHPIRAWDALDHAFRILYDKLQRPTHRYVSTGAAAEILLERSVYGEGLTARNLCGRLFRRYDGAGVASDERYDFKGNLLESVRQFAVEYRQTIDWSVLAALTDATALDTAAAPLLIAADRYTVTTVYDALNRPIQVVTPYRSGMQPSVLRPSYNEANLLERVDVWLRLASAPTALLDPTTADHHAVTDLGYNARGQRILFALGNGTVTAYDYDPQTFRLAHLTTSRPASFAADQRVVQDLAYTYDPTGNVTRIRDTADVQNVIFFQNQRVEPSTDYTYDSLYRLTRATGREHLGKGGGGLNSPQQVTHDDSFRTGIHHPGDGQAVGTYKETYTYDSVGNLLKMLHEVSSGSWSRRYAYTEKSQIVPTETCNRLAATSLPGDPDDGPYTSKYEHDAHGNMTRMPHLSKLVWDEQDRLRSTARQVTAGTPETTYNVYDAGGQRQRKVTDSSTGSRRTERLYLGAIEIHRVFAADGTTITLERETLHVTAGPDRVALIETRTAGTDPAPAQLVRYQYGNHLGSAVLELDDKADIVSYEEYFPYGSTAYQAVRNATETPKRYRYTGKERDEENDLYYYGARYYAPWLGRWTSCDPSEKERQRGYPNPYEYCRGCPIVVSDPDGRDIVELRGSQMSAEALVTKIKNEESIPKQIRDAINFDSQDGSRITFQKGLEGGKMSKSDAAVWKDWSKLYSQAEIAARSNSFAFTTGELRIFPGQNDLTMAQADAPPGSIGMKENNKFVPLKTALLDVERDSGAVGRVIPSLTQARQLEQKKRETGGAKVVSDQLANGRGLIVIVNRYVYSGNEQPSDREMVNTFFHELALHAGGISQEKVGIAHGTKRVEKLKQLVDKLLPKQPSAPADANPMPLDDPKSRSAPKHQMPAHSHKQRHK